MQMNETRTNPNAVIAAFIDLFQNEPLVKSVFTEMQ